jgi:hypothetical protein
MALFKMKMMGCIVVRDENIAGPLATSTVFKKDEP